MGMRVMSSPLWIYEFCHNVNFSKVERSQSQDHFDKKKKKSGSGCWEKRGNGLSSLKNYHHTALTVALYLNSNIVFWHRDAQKVSMCAAERSSKKGLLLGTSMKSKLENNMKAACGLMRNRPERLNCNTCNTVFWRIFEAICHFSTACSVPMNCTTHNTKHTELKWQEWILLDHAGKWKARKQHEMFSSGVVTRPKHKYFPLIQTGKKNHGTIRLIYTQTWILP